jgi:hypothetical protein
MTRIGTGRGRTVKFVTRDFQEKIDPYGVISEWSQTRGVRYSLLTPGSEEHTIKVTLLFPADRPGAADNREVRTELYLQAESIIEIAKHHFQLVTPPVIILGGQYDHIEGTVEISFMEG